MHDAVAAYRGPVAGIGRGRIDLVVTKPYTSPDGKLAVQREVIELKVRPLLTL